MVTPTPSLELWEGSRLEHTAGREGSTLGLGPAGQVSPTWWDDSPLLQYLPGPRLPCSAPRLPSFHRILSPSHILYIYVFIMLLFLVCLREVGVSFMRAGVFILFINVSQAPQTVPQTPQTYNTYSIKLVDERMAEQLESTTFRSWEAGRLKAEQPSHLPWPG